MADISQLLADLLVDMKKEFPGFRVVNKEESRLMRFLGVVSKPFNPRFMAHYATTLGNTVYVPKLWTASARYGVLRHERIHLRDAKRMPLGFFWVSYLFFLPAFFTMRAYWEYRAYTETMKVEYELHGSISKGTVDWLVEVFAGPGYFFMCPSRKFIRRKLEQTKADIMAGKV